MPPKNSKYNKTSLRKKKPDNHVSCIKLRSKRPVVIPGSNKEDETVPSTSVFEPTTSFSSTKKKSSGNNVKVERELSPSSSLDPDWSPYAKKKSPRSKKKVKSVSSTSSAPKSTLSSSPKNKTSLKSKKVKPVPSTSAVSKSPSPSTKERSSKYGDYVVTPKIRRSFMNAYKQSPDYLNLKKGIFNTSFRSERPRGDYNIEIFTPEEEEKFRRENPPIEHDLHNGDKTASILMSMPELNIDDVEEEIAAIKAKQAKSKIKPKRGRKKSTVF